MRKLITLIGIALLTTSCIKLTGNLDVTETILVKEKYGFLNLKTRNIKVSPNSYSASLSIKSDKNFTLKLEKGKDTIDIPLKADKDLNIPNDGKFTVSHEKIDQPFDLNGVINTDVESSQIYREIESCTWESKRRMCEKVCDRQTRKCETVCREITTTAEGRRNVEYHNVTTTRELELEFSKANSSAVIAVFKGRGVESSRINDYYGDCRLR